jgi:hypothetical protein
MRKLSYILTTVVANLALLGLPTSANAARCVTIHNCPGTSKPSLNQFTNNPQFGDERRFYSGKPESNQVGGYQDTVLVKDGQVVQLRLFVHNSANGDPTKLSKNVAKNVTASVQLPNGKVTSGAFTSTAVLDGSNTSSISDTMTFKGDRPFTLTFVSGSAEWHPNIGSQRMLGDMDGRSDRLSFSLGNIRAGFSFEGVVVMKVKVGMPAAASAPTKSKPDHATSNQSGRSNESHSTNTSERSSGQSKPAPQPTKSHSAPSSTHKSTQPAGSGSGSSNNQAPQAASVAPAVQASVPSITVVQTQTQSQEQAAPQAVAAQPPVAQPSTATQAPAGEKGQLPATGATATGLLGSGALGYALVAYRRSRRGLRQALSGVSSER